MPQLVATIEDFYQTSNWTGYNQGSGPYYSTPTTDTDNKAFVISGIMAGSSINSAVITATNGSPSTGSAIRRIDNVSPNFSGSQSVTAKLQGLGGVYTSGVTFEFKFKANGESGTVSSAGTAHSATLWWRDITLTIDYTLPYSACVAPSAASLDAAVSEGNLNVTYSGAAGGTNNAMTGLEVQYAESDDNASWGAWAAYSTVATGSGSGSFAVAPSSTRARYRRFQLRTQGAAGADYYSGWMVVPGSVRRNSAPATPGVTAPVASKTIYNAQPRILATVGSDADGHTQTIAASGYAASSAGAQAVGKKLVLRRSSAAGAGAQSISVSSTDALGVASSSVGLSFSYAVPAWTDPSLVAGTAPIKAAHMTELQAAINNVRAYYGMAAYAFSVITAGVTGLVGWTGHVAELRAAIDHVVSLVNGWDAANGTNDISLPAWTVISVNCPAAAVIDQLRAAIPLL